MALDYAAIRKILEKFKTVTNITDVDTNTVICGMPELEHDVPVMTYEVLRGIYNTHYAANVNPIFPRSLLNATSIFSSYDPQIVVAALAGNVAYFNQAFFNAFSNLNFSDQRKWAIRLFDAAILSDNESLIDLFIQQSFHRYGFSLSYSLNASRMVIIGKLLRELQDGSRITQLGRHTCYRDFFPEVLLYLVKPNPPASMLEFLKHCMQPDIFWNVLANTDFDVRLLSHALMVGLIFPGIDYQSLLDFDLHFVNINHPGRKNVIAARYLCLFECAQGHLQGHLINSSSPLIKRNLRFASGQLTNSNLALQSVTTSATASTAASTSASASTTTSAPQPTLVAAPAPPYSTLTSMRRSLAPTFPTSAPQASASTSSSTTAYLNSLSAVTSTAQSTIASANVATVPTATSSSTPASLPARRTYAMNPAQSSTHSPTNRTISPTQDDAGERLHAFYKSIQKPFTHWFMTESTRNALGSAVMNDMDAWFCALDTENLETFLCLFAMTDRQAMEALFPDATLSDRIIELLLETEFVFVAAPGKGMHSYNHASGTRQRPYITLTMRQLFALFKTGCYWEPFSVLDPSQSDHGRLFFHYWQALGKRTTRTELLIKYDATTDETNELKKLFSNHFSSKIYSYEFYNEITRKYRLDKESPHVSIVTSANSNFVKQLGHSIETSIKSAAERAFNVEELFTTCLTAAVTLDEPLSLPCLGRERSESLSLANNMLTCKVAMHSNAFRQAKVKALINFITSKGNLFASRSQAHAYDKTDPHIPMEIYLQNHLLQRVNGVLSALLEAPIQGSALYFLLANLYGRMNMPVYSREMMDEFERAYNQPVEPMILADDEPSNESSLVEQLLQETPTWFIRKIMVNDNNQASHEIRASSIVTRLANLTGEHVLPATIISRGLSNHTYQGLWKNLSGIVVAPHCFFLGYAHPAVSNNLRGSNTKTQIANQLQVFGGKPMTSIAAYLARLHFQHARARQIAESPQSTKQITTVKLILVEYAHTPDADLHSEDGIRNYVKSNFGPYSKFIIDAIIYRHHEIVARINERGNPLTKEGYLSLLNDEIRRTPKYRTSGKRTTGFDLNEALIKARLVPIKSEDGANPDGSMEGVNIQSNQIEALEGDEALMRKWNRWMSQFGDVVGIYVNIGSLTGMEHALEILSHIRSVFPEHPSPLIVYDLCLGKLYSVAENIIRSICTVSDLVPAYGQANSSVHTTRAQAISRRKQLHQAEEAQRRAATAATDAAAQVAARAAARATFQARAGDKRKADAATDDASTKRANTSTVSNTSSSSMAPSNALFSPASNTTSAQTNTTSTNAAASNSTSSRRTPPPAP